MAHAAKRGARVAVSMLGNALMAMRIVSFEGRSFAYAQHYAVDSWPQLHFAHLPAGSRAIDAFIGEPDMLGVGHGARFLRLLAEELRRAGAPVVAMDPEVDNLRARRARHALHLSSR